MGRALKAITTIVGNQFQYKKNIAQPQITRAGVSISPLQSLNVASGNLPTLYSANDPVKHGDMLYVGGADTETLTFDFSTKVAGSVAECPIKLFRGQWAGATPLSPSDGGFAEETLQSVYDNLKVQESTNYLTTTSTNPMTKGALLEVDLTQYCNLRYGGSNSAMKADLVNIVADVWAMGSGSNASVATNGVILKMWQGSWMQVATLSGGTISKFATTPITNNAYIDANNKLYILLHSTYPSDGTIASSVSLDYAKISITFKRSADVVAPQTVKLPRYFAMLVKGFSPNFDVNSIILNSRIVDIGAKIDLRIQGAIGSPRFQLTKVGTPNAILQSAIQSFAKNQSYTIIFGQNASGMFMHVLKNNGTSEKVANTDMQDASGVYQLYLGASTLNSLQANALYESMTLFDLRSFPSGFSDAGATALLKGEAYDEALGKNYGELVTNGDFSQGGTGWTVASGTWDFSSGKAVLTASGTYQRISQTINVLPQTLYVFNSDIIGENHEYVLTYLDSSNAVLGTLNLTSVYMLPYKITAPNNCSKIKIDIRNGNVTTGTFTFDNISLKQVRMATVPTLPPKNLVPNGDFSQGSTGWTLHANASVQNGKLVLNATGVSQLSYIDAPVLPNNTYKLTFNKTNTKGLGFVDSYINNIKIETTADLIGYNLEGDFTRTFTTKANVNKVRLGFRNDGATATGTFTFDDIKLTRLD